MFSRDTPNAVIANVETREWRREFNLREGFHLNIRGLAPLMMWSASLVFFGFVWERTLF